MQKRTENSKGKTAQTPSAGVKLRYNTGCMPNTDFRYEEFEGLLGSFYLTLRPFSESKVAGNKDDFVIALKSLNELAERYGIQKPEDAVKSPRSTQHEWGKSHAFGSMSMTLDAFRSFYSDFGVGTVANSPDIISACNLRDSVVRISLRS